MIHGWELVEEARKWLGTPYKFGAEVRVGLDDPRKTGWDCSEFIQFLMVKLTGEDFVDGSHNQFLHCKAAGLLLPVERARYTPGALLFRRKQGTGVTEHVALSSGANTTIEARGAKWGTGEWPWRVNTVEGQEVSAWTDAALIPGVDYAPAA